MRACSVLIGVETRSTESLLATSVEITREREPELVLSEAEGLQLGLEPQHQSVFRSCFWNVLG